MNNIVKTRKTQRSNISTRRMIIVIFSYRRMLYQESIREIIP
jgi:hypothetical protein